MNEYNISNFEKSKIYERYNADCTSQSRNEASPKRNTYKKFTSEVKIYNKNFKNKNKNNESNNKKNENHTLNNKHTTTTNTTNNRCNIAHLNTTINTPPLFIHPIQTPPYIFIPPPPFFTPFFKHTFPQLSLYLESLKMATRKRKFAFFIKRESDNLSDSGSGFEDVDNEDDDDVNDKKLHKNDNSKKNNDDFNTNCNEEIPTNDGECGNYGVTDNRKFFLENCANQNIYRHNLNKGTRNNISSNNKKSNNDNNSEYTFGRQAKSNDNPSFKIEDLLKTPTEQAKNIARKPQQTKHNKKYLMTFSEHKSQQIHLKQEFPQTALNHHNKQQSMKQQVLQQNQHLQQNIHMQQYCLVCGDRASGRHYGVLSCDGCRGKFLRFFI